MGFVFSGDHIERQRQAFTTECCLAAYMALSALLDASLLLNDDDGVAQQKFVQQTFIEVPCCQSKCYRAEREQCYADALSD